MYSVAEADVDTWVGHHGLEITLSDGTLFAHFEGHSMGQGGVKFDYCEVLQSTGVPIAYIDCTSKYFTQKSDVNGEWLELTGDVEFVGS